MRFQLTFLCSKLASPKVKAKGRQTCGTPANSLGSLQRVLCHLPSSLPLRPFHQVTASCPHRGMQPRQRGKFSEDFNSSLVAVSHLTATPSWGYPLKVKRKSHQCTTKTVTRMMCKKCVKIVVQK